MTAALSQVRGFENLSGGGGLYCGTVVRQRFAPFTPPT